MKECKHLKVVYKRVAGPISELRRAVAKQTLHFAAM